MARGLATRRWTPTAATTIRTAPTLTALTPTPTAKTRASQGALYRCIEPLAADEFFGSFWEKEPLVLPRAEAGRFTDLLSTEDIERLLCSGGLRYPAFRLVKAGAHIGLHEYTTDVSWRPHPFTATADPGRIAEEFARGATIVLQALHHNWLPVARFCRELEAELGHPAQANAYYTPRRSQGFGVHHDTHDVFCLQISGEKRWLVYAPLLELPLKHQRYSPELGRHGDPIADLTVKAGDTLYLPRGWLHEALTSETDSLHITVGVVTYTWLDAVKAALAECEADVEFRRAVPEDGTEEVDLAARLAERLRPDDVSARKRRRLVETRRPILEGQLSAVAALESLDLDTEVERRPTVLAEIEETTLLFEGTRLAFPARLQEELEAIFSAEGPFTARDLPGPLDDEGRLVLVRRLIREGFLRHTGVE
jgi:ribosomal protein L16 Arg81 hydroxylase